MMPDQPLNTVPADLPVALRAVLNLAARAKQGSLDVTLWDGRNLRFAGGEPGPAASLTVHHPRMARRFVLGGQVAFAEAYMDGDWDTSDLAALLEFFLVNHEVVARHYDGGLLLRAMRRLWHWRRANTRTGSKRNIAHHYDLGNSFYERWLDPTMTYSSAVFGAPDQDLSAAQRNKYRLIAEKLAIAPGSDVLEIGCGWGGFATHIAREHDCRVTAITVSKAQYEYAAARVQREGLADKVQVRLTDYRDVDQRFDRIASIEMFEAVGERHWPVFFGKLRDCLADGGRASLQVITIADGFFDSYRRGVDFIQRYIFPGGMLPSPSALAAQARRAGLAIARQEFFAADYARTLAAWNQRFQAAWPELAPMGFDRRFKRMWEFYLAYCEAGFRRRSIDVTQVALVRS
jgi:cyclopropane-fatty-acyl-phospholipid synthase